MDSKESSANPLTPSYLSIGEWLALAAGAAILLFFLIHNPTYFWIEGLSMLEILAVTFFTRSISARYALTLFCQGLLISAGLMLVIWNIAFKLGVNVDGVFWSGQVVPFLEETLKIVPVLVSSVLVWRSRRFIFNMSDWATLAVMAGAGFSILEKYFWNGISFDFTYGPHIGSWYFFPDALGIFVEGEKFGYIGHAAGTGFIGLAIGLGLFLKWSQNAVAKKLWWLVPLAIFLWVTLEHMLNNMYYADGSTALLSLGGGQFTPGMISLILVIVLALDVMNARRLFTTSPAVAQQITTAWQTIRTHWSLSNLVKALKHLRVMNLLAWEQYRKQSDK